MTHDKDLYEKESKKLLESYSAKEVAELQPRQRGEFHAKLEIIMEELVNSAPPPTPPAYEVSPIQTTPNLKVTAGGFVVNLGDKVTVMNERDAFHGQTGVVSRTIPGNLHVVKFGPVTSVYPLNSLIQHQPAESELKQHPAFQTK